MVASDCVEAILWVINGLNHYSGLASFASIGVAIILFFNQRKNEKRLRREDLYDRISRFCATIIKDIIALRNTLNNPNYKKEISPDGKTNFTHIILFTKIYEGLLYSGLFTYFESELQINLDNMYAKIEYRNELLKERINVLAALSVNPNAKLQEMYDNYQQLLTLSEAEIKMELDVLQERLRDESTKFQLLK